MARRTYSPSSRPNKGANIRIGNCELVDHVDRPIGSGNLYKNSVDACGAVAGRKVTYGTYSKIAQQQLYGRYGIPGVTDGPIPYTPSGPPENFRKIG